MVLGCNYNDCAFGCENEYHVCFELLGKVFCLLERERESAWLGQLVHSWL